MKKLLISAGIIFLLICIIIATILAVDVTVEIIKMIPNL